MVFGGRKGDGGGNALTAGSKNSRCLFLIPASAFARVVQLRLRSAFADLAFRCAPGRTCAVLRTATSVPPLDRVPVARGGDAAKAAVILDFYFWESWTASGKLPVATPLRGCSF